MPINSGNKKVNNAFDQRTAGSDNAQVASLGGRIFNLGGSNGGGNPTALGDQMNWTPWIIGGVIVAALWFFNRK
jgi:hypothetical protein